MGTARTGAYTADDDIVDYILGITFEIWEQRGVELIHHYYGEDCIVWGLDGITHGAGEVVDATWQTLKAFPDRRLIAENVIWSGNRSGGYYTSHRLLSLGTNKGDTVFGPATGAAIRMTNIADCFIEDGVITKEWLVRDNMTLAQQLGAEPVSAARDMAKRRTDEHQAWIDSEIARLASADRQETQPRVTDARKDPDGFARRVLDSCWAGDKPAFDTVYAPYSVLHRTPLRQYSGRDDIFGHYDRLRAIVGGANFSVDHVASVPFSDNGVDIAIRWTAAGTHDQDFYGVAPTGKPMFILGVTHLRCVDNRVISESTVFDDLALLSQVVQT